MCGTGVKFGGGTDVVSPVIPDWQAGFPRLASRPSMSDKSNFHFTGICGTAMGAVAAAMKQRGFTVTGSDANVYPPMSDFLRGQGITLTEGYAEENIPADTDVVIIGNAISRGNPEAEAALDRKLLYHSLPEVMKEFFLRGKRNFVVSGTHGKTTTSSMLAWIFVNAGRDPGYMIGGLPKNLGHGAHFTDSEFNVLEGDEYDTAFFDKRSKFLHYLPECVVVNNVEFDHADIYNNLDEIKLTFRRLLNIVPRRGVAFINGDEQNCLDVATRRALPRHHRRLRRKLQPPDRKCQLRAGPQLLHPRRRSLLHSHDRRVQRPQRRHGRRRRHLRRTHAG